MCSDFYARLRRLPDQPSVDPERHPLLQRLRGRGGGLRVQGQGQGEEGQDGSEAVGRGEATIGFPVKRV